MAISVLAVFWNIPRTVFGYTILNDYRITVIKMNHPDFDMAVVREQLCALQQQSRDDSNQSKSQRATVELDSTTTGRLSRMDALQAQAMAQAAERRRAVQVQRIGQALKRIDEGVFGECIECGEWIAQPRLELDLTTLKCIDCAE